MSKYKKLIFKPTLFWRDFFLKRAPLQLEESITPLPAEKGVITVPPSKQIQHLPQSKRLDKVIDSSDLEDLYPITFPIDIVYTWVDADDPEFLQLKEKYQQQISGIQQQKSEISDIARFESRDELKYSIRSLVKYASWINHIYIVTNGQIPKWLDTTNEKISIVPHSKILDVKYLPTFNSHVIESSLHKIPGLSEHYIYLNDDVLLTRPIKPNYFFTSGGLVKSFITNSLLPGGPKHSADTPTQWAAKNARDILYKFTRFYPVNMFAHTFHPQLKSIHEQMEKQWSAHYDLCRKNRFRGESDINTATFLSHHYAIIQGKGIITRTKCMYFNIRTPSAVNFYHSILARKDKDEAPYSICLNDHKSNITSSLSDYAEKLNDFLNSYYPEVSEYEKIPPSKEEIILLLKTKKYQEIHDLLKDFVEYNLIPFHKNKHQLYILYYYGLACKKLYEKNRREKQFLNDAINSFKTTCQLNPKHNLARQYFQSLTSLG